MSRLYFKGHLSPLHQNYKNTEITGFVKLSLVKLHFTFKDFMAWLSHAFSFPYIQISFAIPMLIYAASGQIYQ